MLSLCSISRAIGRQRTPWNSCNHRVNRILLRQRCLNVSRQNLTCQIIRGGGRGGPFDSLCECTVWYICMRGVAEHGRFSGYYISKDKNWTRVLARRWRRCVSVCSLFITRKIPHFHCANDRANIIVHHSISRYFVPCDYSFLTFLPEIYYYGYLLCMYLVFRDKYDIVISLERCLGYNHIKPSKSSFANEIPDRCCLG